MHFATLASISKSLANSFLHQMGLAAEVHFGFIVVIPLKAFGASNNSSAVFFILALCEVIGEVKGGYSLFCGMTAWWDLQ